MCPFLMCFFNSVCAEISFQPTVPVSQILGCPTVSTRSACVTTLGLSNSSKPQCLCHNSRSVQQFQPEVPVSQLSVCPTVSTQSACHNSRTVLQFQFNILCLNLCHKSRSVQQFQPEVPVSQLSVCPTVSTRNACVTTLGRSNSSIQHIVPEPVLQLSVCPTVSPRSVCVTTLRLSNSFNSTYCA